MVKQPCRRLGGNRKAEPVQRGEKLAVATWGTQCTLAKAASLMLLSAGFDVIEIGGGIAAWKESSLPVEPVA
jgi:hypothetical protein